MKKTFIVAILVLVMFPYVLLSEDTTNIVPKKVKLELLTTYSIKESFVSIATVTSFSCLPPPSDQISFKESLSVSPVLNEIINTEKLLSVSTPSSDKINIEESVNVPVPVNDQINLQESLSVSPVNLTSVGNKQPFEVEPYVLNGIFDIDYQSISKSKDISDYVLYDVPKIEVNPFDTIYDVEIGQGSLLWNLRQEVVKYKSEGNTFMYEKYLKEYYSALEIYMLRRGNLARKNSWSRPTR